MDLHPLFIHFPIALLTIYAILEFIRPKKLINNQTWKYIKIVFLIIGVLGAFASLSTGEQAKHSYDNYEFRSLIDTHAGWAVATTYIFLFLGIFYLIGLFEVNFGNQIRKKVNNKLFNAIWKIITKISAVMLSSPLIYILTIAGLICISVTGALGGVLVHGPSTDPITQIAYNLFS